MVTVTLRHIHACSVMDAPQSSKLLVWVQIPPGVPAIVGQQIDRRAANPETDVQFVSVAPLRG